MNKRLRNLLPSWAIHLRRYCARHGRVPNLVRPSRFSEKLIYRKLFDRRQIWIKVVDKVAVRSFVESRLGPDILPRAYHITSDPETIPFEKLPGCL